MGIRVVRSVEDFTKEMFLVNKPEYTLFRGQSRDWDLVPRLARKEFQFGDVLSKEYKSFSEFKKRAPLLLTQIQIQGSLDWEWLALAQHHGMATRLLDWSKNPLIALYFTVEFPYKPIGFESSSKGYGVLWMLEYTSEMEEGCDDEESPFKVETTKLFFPKYVTSRITNQSGCFTVHNFSEDEDRFVPLQEDSKFKRKLRKLKVPASCFANIRKQLEFLGIHAASVYPDIDGLTKYLTNSISVSVDEKQSLVDNIKESIKKNSSKLSIIR
jgi:hypothetical protein